MHLAGGTPSVWSSHTQAHAAECGQVVPATERGCNYKELCWYREALHCATAAHAGMLEAYQGHQRNQAIGCAQPVVGILLQCGVVF